MHYHSYHCLHDILTPKTMYRHTLGDRGHNFILAECHSNLYKVLSVNTCVF